MANETTIAHAKILAFFISLLLSFLIVLFNPFLLIKL
jgi:hypothetical protein